MALNNVQLRVERSIFEAIRLRLVANGYLPDQADPRYNDPSTAEGLWEEDVAAIETAMNFAAEVFGHGSSLEKGNKKTPRLAIIPRRIMPGDIGTNIAGGFSPDPLNPDNTQKLIPSLQSANYHIDVNIVPGSADEDRVMHAILGEALSTLKYIPMYDNPTEVFLIRQFNFYDLPDNKNGISEKSYSYEIPDLYLYEGKVISDVPLITQITVNMTAQSVQSILTRTGSLIGPFVDPNSDIMYMDTSGISFKLP